MNKIDVEKEYLENSILIFRRDLNNPKRPKGQRYAIDENGNWFIFGQGNGYFKDHTAYGRTEG